MSDELIAEAEESKGQRVIELVDMDTDVPYVAYTYVGHLTMNPRKSWVYTSGAEGHLCDVSIVKTSLENPNEGVGVRFVDKDDSLFAGEWD